MNITCHYCLDFVGISDTQRGSGRALIKDCHDNSICWSSAGERTIPDPRRGICSDE